jgi:chromatin modification-related protein VID21
VASKDSKNQVPTQESSAQTVSIKKDSLDNEDTVIVQSKWPAKTIEVGSYESSVQRNGTKTSDNGKPDTVVSQQASEQSLQKHLPLNRIDIPGSHLITQIQNDSNKPIESSDISLPPNSSTRVSPSDPSSQLHSEASRTTQPSSPSHSTDLQPDTIHVEAGLKRDFSAMNGDSESSLAKRRKGQSPGNSITSMSEPSFTTAEAKAPIRIDTSIKNYASAGLVQGSIETPITSKSAQGTIQVSTPERMTTRVASGAIRHKSVSEIIGETPRSANADDRSIGDRSSAELRETGTQTPRSSRVVVSPDSATFRSRLHELKEREKEREKDRSKLSTVVFPRQQPSLTKANSDVKYDELRKRDKIWEQKDYLVPLFAAQASAQTPTLHSLLLGSSKTMDTNNHHLEYRETQDCRILKRIYHLQNSNRWSLRQLERSKEPDRPLSHWDMLLGESKWLRTDFREERKWKLAAAKNLADWCAEWVNSPKEERSSLQVKIQKLSRRLSSAENHTTPISLPNGGGISHSEPTPDLIPSTADDVSESADEEIPNIDLSRSIAPAALFSLAPEDVLFGIHHTPATDKILEELPLYQLWNDSKGQGRPYSMVLDSEWKQPIVPVSKYTTGKILLKATGPIKKRGRYDFAEEDEIDRDASGHTLIPLDTHKEPLPPEKNDVAFFDPESRHIIARLHASHAFRPPSEFNMPSQSFFESRTSSQWTVAEDDKLRRYVREYEYNWSLISACMSSESLFSSGAERRTPWECFERWVSFEGLPGDMARHQYFRAWNARRDSAREHLDQIFLAQQQQQQQQQQAQNGTQPPPRRKTAEPLTVERRKQTKHIAIFHAMFKVQKKREMTLHKQQQGKHYTTL